MTTARFASVFGAVRLLGRGSTADEPVPGFAVPRTIDVVVVGAHGGAGATSVCDLLDLAASSDRDERAHPHVALDVDAGPGRLPPPGGVTVLVVARTTASGLAAGAELVNRRPHEGSRLVLVADAPAPPPPAVRYRAEALAGQLPVLWVPWLWPLRAVDRVADAAESRKVRLAAAALRNFVIEEEQA